VLELRKRDVDLSKGGKTCEKVAKFLASATPEVILDLKKKDTRKKVKYFLEELFYC
jgi:hypothetical protein